MLLRTGSPTSSVLFIKTRSLPSLPMVLSRRSFFLNVYQTLFSAGRCWLVAAFLPGLTGRAMMSAFLSSAHCQLKWFSQRKLQGKVAASVPLQRVGAGKAQWVLRQARCARVWSVSVLAFPTFFFFFFNSFQFRRKLLGYLLSSQTRNLWDPALSTLPPPPPPAPHTQQISKSVR